MRATSTVGGLRRGSLGVALALGAAGVGGCSAKEGSIALYFPNPESQAAAKQIQVFIARRERAGVVELSCEEILGRIAVGDSPVSDAVDEPIDADFNGKVIAAFPVGNPLIHVVLYNDIAETKKPILEGCTEEFDTGGSADEVRIDLEVIVPNNTQLVKRTGDRQVAHPGESLAEPLRIFVDASLPGAAAGRYPLPGIPVTFAPDPTLSVGGAGAGQSVVVRTGPDGIAEVPVRLPETSGSFAIAVEAPALWESISNATLREQRMRSSRATARVSAVARAEFGQRTAVPIDDVGDPVAIEAGDVSGENDVDLVVLGCDSADPKGCLRGRLAEGDLGRTRVTVVNEVLDAPRSTRLSGDLGILPAGLVVGPILPSEGGLEKDDIAFVNSRRPSCQAEEPPCQGSEIRLLRGRTQGPRYERYYPLTSSNAVGLTSYRRLPSDVHLSLATAGQGRRDNDRPCRLGSGQCLSHKLATCVDGSYDQCGCPPGEVCECPPSSTCSSGEAGVCVAQDRDIAQLSVRSVGNLVEDNRCHLPTVDCDKGAQMPRSTCSCADNPTGCGSNLNDNCSCKVPNRLIVGIWSSTQVPNDLVVTPLREAAVEVIAASEAGIEFFQYEQGRLAWKDRQPVNVPIHRLVAEDLDADDLRDVIWVAGGACVRANNRDVCPVASVIEAPETAGGCLGLYVLDPTKKRIDERKEDGCRRYDLPLVPEDLCAGDFDGDGKVDVAVSSRGVDYLSVFLGNGEGGLLYPGDRVPLPDGAVGGPLTCADLDGDGRTDVAVVDAGGQRVSVLVAGP